MSGDACKCACLNKTRLRWKDCHALSYMQEQYAGRIYSTGSTKTPPRAFNRSIKTKMLNDVSCHGRVVIIRASVFLHKRSVFDLIQFRLVMFKITTQRIPTVRATYPAASMMQSRVPIIDHREHSFPQRTSMVLQCHPILRPMVCTYTKHGHPRPVAPGCSSGHNRVKAASILCWRMLISGRGFIFIASLAFRLGAQIHA